MPGKKKKRILFISEAVTMAHVVRPLSAMRSLSREKYDIFYACGDRYRKLAEDEGINAIRIHTLPADALLDRIVHYKPMYTEEDYKNYVSAELELYKSLKPDLIVTDNRLSASISSRLAGIPHIALVNAYWSPYADFEFPLPDLGFLKALEKGPAGQMIKQKLYPTLLKRFARVYESVCRSYNLEWSGDLRHVHTQGGWTGYWDLPEMVPVKNLPPNHRFIGPSLWEPKDPLPDWWDRVDPDKPKAYVSMGSSGNEKILPIIVKVLLDLKQQVLITTPQQLPWGEKDGVFQAPTLPGIRAMAGCSILINHGGSGTMYQALINSVPILGIYSNADQAIGMECIKNAGLGYGFHSHNAKYAVIHKYVSEILKDKYRENAQKMSLRIKSWDTGAHFESLIDSALSQNQIKEVI